MKKIGGFLSVALILVTFGLFFFYWFYVTYKDFLEETGGKANVLVWTILQIVPFVSLYSNYKFLNEGGKVLDYDGLVYWLISIIPIANLVIIGVVQSKWNKKFGKGDVEQKSESEKGKISKDENFKDKVIDGVKNKTADMTKLKEISTKNKKRKGPAVYEFEF